MITQSFLLLQPDLGIHLFLDNKVFNSPIFF